MTAMLGAWLFFGLSQQGEGVPSVEAATNYESGTFVKSTSTGSQEINGLGFRPKAVIFYWNRQTADGFASEQSSGIGFTNGPNDERAVAIAENDAADTSNAGRRKSASQSIIILNSGSPTVGAAAELTSLNADGFTLNWLINEASADIIHYVAIGGTDITNVDIGSFNVSGSTGSQSVTGVGFQPDALLTLHGNIGDLDTNLSSSSIGFGVATSSSEQGAFTIGSNDGQAANAGKLSTQSTSAVLLNELPGGTDAVADFTSFDSDGFTINVSNAPQYTWQVFYLAVKGAQFNVGSFSQSVSTGSQDITGVGFQPTGLLTFGVNQVTGANRTAPSTFSFGTAQTAESQSGIWSEVDNVDPSDANMYSSSSYILTHASSPSTIDAQARLSRFLDDGFRLIWDTADTTAREVIYFAVGSVPIQIDSAVTTVGNSQVNSGRQLVFIDQNTGYFFYRDSDDTCVYSKTTDGGDTWGSAVAVDSQTDCFRITVWYDQWTPGDTGDIIHIVTIDSGDDDLWYTGLDTSNDTQSTTVSITGSYAGTYLNSENYPAITKSTTGNVYIGVQDSDDSFVLRCASSCANAVNWSEAGSATNPFDATEDGLILMPLDDGDILAIRWDTSANVIDSNRYEDGSDTWDGSASWDEVVNPAYDNTTYDFAFSATTVNNTNNIYLAHAADHGTFGTNDDVRTAIYDVSTDSWTVTADVATDVPGAIGGVNIGYDAANGHVYVAYIRMIDDADITTGNVYWSRSTDGMSTWSSEEGPINDGESAINGPHLDARNTEILYSAWTDFNVADAFGTVLVDPNVPLINQEAYRFFANDDSTDVGTPLAAQDSAITLSSDGQEFRLRMLINVSDEDLSTGLYDFKLQYAPRVGTCDTGFVGESYVDVTASTDIAFNDNATPADGDTLTTNANDPTGAGSVVAQTYEELNSFTTISSVATGNSALFDFSLVDYSSLNNATYCFRIVNDSGSALYSYSEIPELTTLETTFRVTEYLITNTEYTGTNYTLTLDQDLADDYFVIIRGSDGTATSSGNRNGRENYPTLIADPTGTGDLSVSSGSNQIELERFASTNGWYGVVTVVECIFDCAASGFELLDVQLISHATDAAGTDTSGTPWSDVDQVSVFVGMNGSGCKMSDGGMSSHNACWIRAYPISTDTIRWSRDGSLTNATSTAMIVEWGSEWTVQHVQVSGSGGGGNGVNTTGEYYTGSLTTSVNRDETWVWGSGTSANSGIGDGSEAVVVTLGDGVNQNSVESSVAIGSEYSAALDFEVYTFTHPDLAVDYVFKTDGDSGSNVYDATVTSAPEGSRMAIGYNTQNGTGTAYPRPIFSSRYTADDTIRMQRRRNGQAWAAWIQGIDFSNISLAAGGSLTIDIVDSGGTSVSSPSSDFGSIFYDFFSQQANGTLLGGSDMVRVANDTANAAWSASIAAVSGSVATWSDGSNEFDYNDPTANAQDGGDTDSVGGQMTVDPSSSNISPETGCSSTGISLGSATSFSEGVTDSISLFSASGSADTGCYWDFIDIDVDQTIPAEQPVGTNYSIDMSLTIVSI